MATLKIVLSLDGRHRVDVVTDNPAETRTALEWAQQVYEQLPLRSGAPELKRESQEEPAPVAAFSHEVSRPKGDRNLSPEGEPTCPEHGEMARSKFGGWYCPAKDGEGWCKYKIRQI